METCTHTPTLYTVTSNTMTSRNILFGILFVLVLAAGFGIARFSTSSTTSYTQNVSGTPAVAGQPQTASGTVSGNTTGGIVVKPSNLTDGQKKMLSVMGIDPNHIVLTPTMIACANASLGSDRIKALEGGATPSFTEGIKLAACYK